MSTSLPVTDDGDSWRPARTPRWRRVLRLVSRGLMTLLAAALLWMFVRTVFEPWTHGSLSMVALTGADYDGFQVPPLAFQAEDLEALAPIAKVFRGGTDDWQVRGLARPQALSQLTGRLNANVEQSDEMLVVYAAAHGVSVSGSAYLLCGNFDVSRPADGRIPLRELLTVISRAPAHNKLLILDVGRFTYDPRLGMLANDFPELLAREVGLLGDPNLWVFSATSSGERSHVSSASQRSVFGFYLEQALGGAADLNADGAIRLDELQRFVSKAVSNCVYEATAGAETQTPLLVASSGNSTGRLPIIGPPVRPARVPPAAVRGRFAADFRRQASAANMSVAPAAAAIPAMRSPTAAIERVLRPPTFNSPMPRVLPNSAMPKLAGGGSKPAKSEAPPAGAEADKPASAAGQAAGSGTSPATGTPVGTANGADSGKTADSAAASAESLAKLAETLVAAWRLRDDLQGLPDPQVRPLDAAPHRWRALQSQVLGLEQESLAGKSADPKALRRRLEQVVAALKRSDLTDEAEDILLPDAGRNALIQKSIQPRGLALAAALASRNGQPVPADFATALQMLDLAAAGTPDDGFWKWLDSLTPEQDGYVELQSARQFRATPGLSRELLAQTLQVCWLGERIASGALGVLTWVQPALDAADRQRLAAERDLLDPGRLRDDREMGNTLRQAAELYRQAGQRLKTASHAKRLEHELLDRVGDYVRWHNLGPVGTSAPIPNDAALEQLIEELAALVQKFVRPAPAALPAIEQIAGRLELLQDQIEGDLQPAFVASLLERPGPASWNAALLLATPLPSLPARLRLLSAVDRFDQPLERAAGIGSLHTATPAAGEQAWQALQQRANLQLRLARLVMIECPHGQGPIESLEARYRATVGKKPVDAAQLSATSTQWERWRDLGAAFEEFYVALPELIQSSLAHTSLHSSQRERTLKHWRWADLACRLLDARDVVRIKDLMPSQLVERAEFDALLAWQRNRLLATARQTTAQQAKYLVEAARDSFAALAADGYDVPQNNGAQPVELRVPPVLDMRRTARLETELAVQAGEQPGEVWLVAEYDPDLIGLRPAPGHPLYVMDQAGAASDRSSAPRVRPISLSTAMSAGAHDGPGPAAARLLDTAPTWKLASRAGGELKLVVDRKSPNPTLGSLIISAWTRDTVTRQAIEVRLPKPAFVNLAVDTQAGCWAPSGHTLKLYPFPNRTTPYRFLISRTDEQTQKVSAELRLLAARPDTAVPYTAMDADEAAEVLDQLPSSTKLAVAAETLLPTAGRTAPVLFEAAPPPPPSAAQLGAAPAPPAADTPPSLQNGVLIVLTDLASKRVVMRWVELMPQRPRRYIDPHVDYDLAEERVRLRVRTQEGASLPPEGSRIRWQLTNLDEGSVPGPAGELTSGANERVLSTRLAQQTKPVLLLVDVDDYPRSFAFRIDTNTTAIDLPRAELTSIKILSPPARTAYRLPTGPIPVRLEADAPSDDLSGREDFIEVGLDTNRDRILSGEPSVRLTADRRTSVTLEKLAPAGWFEVHAQVQDLAVEVPTVSLASGRVAVLGRVHLGDKSVWSNSVELILDGEPPSVERVTLKPGATIVRGTKLDVLASATDGDLSGVASVEAAFDLANLGKFAEAPKPLPATVDPSGRWAVQLPTDMLALGGYQLLLRATDRVGNVSDYKSVTIRVVSAEAAPKPLNVVTGSVTYGKEPMPQIKLTLAPEKGEKLPPVTSDERGNFVIRLVPPGKYTLAAAGVVRNKMRKAEAKLEVGPPPVRPKPIALELK